jgi:membrane protease YdiL (CAAX protease family)
MAATIDRKRITLFLIFAFGLAWLTGLVVYLTGGIVNSPEFIRGTKITLAYVLIAVVYMWSPGLANIFTRIVTREGWGNNGLRPNFKKSWKYWLAAWLLPPLLVVVGAFVFFLLQPQYFDPGLTTLKSMLPNRGVGFPIPLTLIIVVQMAQGVLISPIINSLFTFGEEFGWRAYLLQKLLPLGPRKAVLILGVIWGIWHAPVIAMGHNYGFNYPLFPWAGIIMMILFTTLLSIFLAWVTLKSNTVWPAVIGHAVINGTAGFAILLAKGNPSTLVGPLPTGILGGAGLILFAVYLFFSKSKLQPIEDPLTVSNHSIESASISSEDI